MKKSTIILIMLFVATTFANAQDAMGVKNLKGNFIEENKVKLSWLNEDAGPYFNPECDIITHEKAGYNNNYDVSSLHSGLTSLGFNADKNAGFQIMDKFTCHETFSLRFFVYAGASPSSTIDGAYLTIYDGDPLNGGNIIAGGDDVNRLEKSSNAFIYRTEENDFSDVSRPVFYVDVNAIELSDNYEENTFWYVVSFTGTSDDDIHIVPKTVMGETATGEARIYTSENGWQPMLDEGTQTQQGVAFETIGYEDISGVVTSVDACNIFRNDELVEQFVPSDSYVTYIDENADHGVNIYGVQNIYTTEFEGVSEIQYCDVRPSYSPKNFECSSEILEDNTIINFLTWQKEDDMQADNVKTYYEIYRKKSSEENYKLIKTIAKVDGQQDYEYEDVAPRNAYEYKINTYNIYETGASESLYVKAEGSVLYQSFFGNDSTRVNIYDSHVIDGEWTHITSIYNSDTVNINGMLYYKSTGDYEYTDSYYREDRETGRLYQYVERNDIYVGDLKVEVLICDMSLNVGDTFQFPHELDYNTNDYNSYWEPIIGIVTDVRYENGKKIIEFDDETFGKLVIYNNTTSLTFTEGVFPVIVPNNNLGTYNELLCQFKDGEQTYHNSGYEECYYKSASVEEIESSNITIKPTLLSNSETISIESDSEIKDVKMVDMLGRKMNVSVDNTNGTSCQVNINQKCNSGIYLIIVETEKGEFYEKVVVRN